MTSRLRCRWGVIAALLFVALVCASCTPVVMKVVEPRMSEADAERFVEACIVGTHAQQVLMQKKSGKGDAECYSPGKLTPEQLQELVSLHAKLLAPGADKMKIVAQIESVGQTFLSAPKDSGAQTGMSAPPTGLSDKLPVNVFTRWLEDCVAQAPSPVQSSQPGAAGPHATRAGIRAIANLYQICLEIDRDGTTLQDAYRAFIAMGLPVHLGQLGLEQTDRSLLAMGTELTDRTCASPFDTKRAAWQIVGRKIENWGEKNRGVVTPEDYAREVLLRPDVAPVVPKLKAMKPQTIAVVGHSFTMNEHWSSAASFTGTVAAAFRLVNPQVLVVHYTAGGMSMTGAKQKFLDALLRDKPNVVFFACGVWGKGDLDALADMTKQLHEVGAQVWCLDRLDALGGASRDAAMEKLREVARAGGITIIEVGPLLDAHPQRAMFMCLDRVHMTPVWHKFMAGELLKFIAGARKAQLGRETAFSSPA